VDCFVDLPYLPARSGEKFRFGALTIVSSVDLVVGQDVGCCKIWTTWRQAECYVKVCTFDQLEKSKIWVLTVIPFGIVMLTIHHSDMMVSVCSM